MGDESVVGLPEHRLDVVVLGFAHRDGDQGSRAKSLGVNGALAMLVRRGDAPGPSAL